MLSISATCLKIMYLKMSERKPTFFKLLKYGFLPLSLIRRHKRSISFIGLTTLNRIPNSVHCDGELYDVNYVEGLLSRTPAAFNQSTDGFD